MTNALIASNLPIPSAIGSLESYVSAVHRIPTLTQQEEQDLAQRLVKDNDLAAAKQLVLSHLRFVVHVAAHRPVMRPSHLPIEIAIEARRHLPDPHQRHLLPERQGYAPHRRGIHFETRHARLQRRRQG